MATEETSNDAKKAGGYVKEKLAIVASRWNEDEVSRAIIKVTSHKLKFPNEKHLARLVQATYGNFNSGSNTYDDVNGYIVQELIPHTHTHNWIVVLKTLLVFHVLLVEGSDDIVVRIANARQVFNTQHMKDLADSPEGAAQMGLIHQYARYLEEKCVALTACRQFPRIENARFADDFCAASPEAAAPVADALLLQMDALLEFEFRANALDNFASLEAYKRSLKDGRLIYVVLTRRIAAMLETFRGYPTVMKKVWISIYKRYADVVKGLSLTFDLINSNTNVNFGEVYPTIKPMPEGVLLQLQDELLAEEVPVVKLSSVLSTPSSLSSAAPVPLAATSIGRNMSPAEAAAAAVASGMAAVQARSRSPDILRRNAAPPAVPIVQQQTAPVGIYGAPQAPFVVDPPPTKPSYASPPTQSAHPVDAFLPTQQPPPPQPPQRNAIDDLFGPTPTAAAPPPAQQPQPLYAAPSQPQPNLFGPSPVAAPQPHYAPAPQPQPTPVAVAPAPAFDPFAQPPGQTNAWGSTTTTAAGQPYHRTQQADFDPFAPVAPAPIRQAPAAQQHGPVDFFGGTGAPQQQQQQPSSASTGARSTAGSAEAQLDFFAQAQQQPNRRAW